jgi:two-component system sensor histidine kinase ChvG
MRHAPDRTPVTVAAAPLPDGRVLMTTSDARDITRVVREERLTSFLIFLGVLALSTLLSGFLARTIVRPLRRLSIAAQRVRLGRAREVTVPRLPRRRDEIGMLARALSDMTQALRQRIDATEAFAADVAHELKNPLASLRSAVETLGSIKDDGLRAQLLDIIRDDVVRIDRLITDIAEVSRLDAELSRTRFVPVDIGAMTAALIRHAERGTLKRGVRIAYARPEPGTAMVMGEESRLSQVVRNLLDNAVSFSPEGGVVRVTVAPAGERVLLRVDDDGPGVPPENREDIFKRFYSARPEEEAFGKHSGLGLAIVRAVVEAHDGSIEVGNRERDGEVLGARFAVSLPAA